MRLTSASERAGRILPGHEMTSGTRTSSSYMAGPLYGRPCAPPMVAVIRAEDGDRRDSASFDMHRGPFRSRDRRFRPARCRTRDSGATYPRSAPTKGLP